MRLLVVAAFVLLAAAAAPAQSASTSLHITVWPQGADGERKTWDVALQSGRQDAAARVEACRRLAALERPFAAIPKTRSAR